MPYQSHFFTKPSQTPIITSPRLMTQRLQLQPVNLSECDEFFTLYGNAKVMKLFDQGISLSFQETQKRVTEYYQRWLAKDMCAPFTMRSHDGIFIGFISLRHAYCKQPGHIELGFMIAESQWSHGYATEAALAVMNYLSGLAANGYLLNGATLNIVSATAHPENSGSLTVLRKLGFQYIGEAIRNNQPRLFFVSSLQQKDCIRKFEPQDLFVNVAPPQSEIRAKL